MVSSILLNYVLAIMIQKGHDSGLDLRARTFLIIAVIANLCLLCYFKYANFLVDSLDFILNAVRLNWLEVRLSPVHLPIGISFFTFHSLSYVIDVYRKVVTAQRNLVNMALYISFFPQLIAGPIIRYHDIAAQIENRNVTPD
jgi:alginate O-acetyltransferase complex protein AlgI